MTTQPHGARTTSVNAAPPASQPKSEQEPHSDGISMQKTWLDTVEACHGFGQAVGSNVEELGRGVSMQVGEVSRVIDEAVEKGLEAVAPSGDVSVGFFKVKLKHIKHPASETATSRSASPRTPRRGGAATGAFKVKSLSSLPPSACSCVPGVLE